MANSGSISLNRRKGQIERTIFELRRNLGYYLQHHPEANVRAVRIDPLSLNEASKWAGLQMLQYLMAVPELSDLKDREMPKPAQKSTFRDLFRRRSGRATPDRSG